MVAAAKRACCFQWQNVRRLLDHTEQVGSARGVRANGAKRIDSKKSTVRAGPNRFPGRRDRTRDRLRLLAARLHDPKSNPFSRARPDSRHLAKLSDQFPDRERIFRLPQNRLLVEGRVGQLESERLKPAQIQLEGPILLAFRSTSILELRVRLGPAFLAIQNDPVPECIA